MKIISKDFKKGIVKLYVNDNEDLWTLKKIINTDDIIGAKSTRKIKKDEEQESKRKPVYLKLKTEKTEFNETSFSLKILGTITDAPEDIPIGSYHSFNINPGDELSIEKTEWTTYDINELKKSETKTTRILITVLDNQEATFALISNEVKELYTIEASLPRKDMSEYETKTRNYYNEVSKQSKALMKTHQAEYLIIAGPGFASEELMKTIKNDKELASKTFQAHTNHTGMNGIKELINSEYINKVLNENEVSEETRIVEDFFKQVGKQRFITYGLQNVSHAVESGAVEKLLISEGLILDYRERKRFKEIESLINKAEQTKAKIEFIGTRHEAGKRFMKFGGIGAKLRYEI